LSTGAYVTTTVSLVTRIFFSPPLYCTVITRSFATLTMLATFALVILLSGLRSQS